MATEEEMRTKWCPMARTAFFVRGDSEGSPVNVVGHAANRVVTDDDGINERIIEVIEATGATRCLGSKCAAYRTVARFRKVSDEKEAPSEVYQDGYCGLAGAL